MVMSFLNALFWWDDSSKQDKEAMLICAKLKKSLSDGRWTDLNGSQRLKLVKCMRDLGVID